MNIALKPEHASVVRSHIQSGNFNTPDEVIEAALLCLQQRNQLTSIILRHVPKIQTALDQIEVSLVTGEFVGELTALE
ncbi:hypothetical protein QT972_26900 [Microcoleus sp. herbarium7]